GKKLGFSYTKEEITGYFENPGKRIKVNPGLPYRDINFRAIKVDKPRIKNTNTGFDRIGSGIESIANKISRDIEKEKIRVEKIKVKLSSSKDRVIGKDRERER
ncbi:MAG: hypothetical protein JW997_05825, partial [Actinobacteria bacterium]|nr:hypothetical protein [Actinomycetota bacterium]